MKTFNEFFNESQLNEEVKISKAVKAMIDNINHLYSIDLTDHITIGNKRNFFARNGVRHFKRALKIFQRIKS